MKHYVGSQRLWSASALLLLLVLCAISTMISAGTAEAAAIRLVSTTGADNADCSVAECRHIQFAINQAAAGDTVLVAAGTYVENISLKTGVHVLSNQGAIIQSNNGVVQVVDASNTGPGTILEGFVITGGNIGIVLFNASAEIRRNVIVNNSGVQAGGIFLQNSSAVIVNNLIRGNTGSSGAGGIEVFSCPSLVSIVNNTIDGNTMSSGFSGQAINIVNATVLIQNNIVSNHNAFPQASIGVVSGAAPTVKNNLFFNNGGVYVDGSGPHTIASLNTLPNNGGNIAGDPLYISAGGGNFHIQTGSPAINAGEPTGAPSVDFDGDARPLGGGVDIGFDEITAGGGGGTQCSDGIDNDGDSLIDLADPGCSNSSDNDESDSPPPGTICSSTVSSVAGLQAEVNGLATSAQSKQMLTSTLASVSAALTSGDKETARTQVASFVREVVRLSNLKGNPANRIPVAQASNLVCGAANVLTGIALP